MFKAMTHNFFFFHSTKFLLQHCHLYSIQVQYLGRMKLHPVLSKEQCSRTKVVCWKIVGHYFGMAPVKGHNVAMISVPTSFKNNCEIVYMTQISKNVLLMLTTYIYWKTALGYTDTFSTTVLQRSAKSASYKVLR